MISSPETAEQQRRDRSNGQRQDDRRVNAREAIHERLARRALRLRALDEVNDARDRRVAAQPRDATSSAPRPLIVPAKTSAPGVFSTGSDSPVTGA